jgi:hypothetical protein
VAKRKTLPTSQSLFHPLLPPQIDPVPMLEQTTPQPSRALVASALSQVGFGQVDAAMLYKAIYGDDEYAALLRWAYNLVSRSMSPGQIMDALHQLAFAALTAGWIAHESGVQSAILTRLISPPPPEAPAPPSPRATTFAQFMRNQRPGGNTASPSPPAQPPAGRRTDSQEPSKDRRSRRKAEEQ